MSDWELEVKSYLSAHPHRSFKVKELQRALRVPGSRYRQFRAHVLGMARDGRIALLPRRRVQTLTTAPVLEGTVAGVGELATHVLLDVGERMPLAEGESAEVVPGDRVRVRRLRVHGVRVAQIQRVLLAGPRTVFGELRRAGPRWMLIPDTRVPGLSGGVFVDEDAAVPAAGDGLLARAQLPAFDPATTRPTAPAVTLLGAADHPRAAMARLIGRSGWPQEFSARAREEARATLDPAPARRDLGAEVVFTIDPLDAKDHDDAVSIARLPDGAGFVLGVHIADVASYVPRDSALDQEALARATSVYPPGGVLPMLPAELSSGECSLHHGVARRAASVTIRYDGSGRRRGFDLGLTWIRSRASLAYEQAEELMENGAPPPPERVDGATSEELRSALCEMLELATLLRERRRDVGSLFVERPERTFTFDVDGHVAQVAWRPQLRTHWIIEEFMLEANRAVAQALHAAELPLLWRVHEEPDELKVAELVEILKVLGVRWKPREPISGHDYGQLLAQVQGSPLASLVSLLTLRSLMKARYRAGWNRHFGLAFEEYTHFTSPIRRYPDLHNQRWVHRLVARAGRGGWVDDALHAAAALGRERPSVAADHEEARRLADHCSEQERRAMGVERAAADICAADALRGREGEVLDGMIVSVVGSGLFVEIDGTGLDGFVAVEHLAGDWYTFDARRQLLMGQRTGRTWHMGQRVRVLLEHVDVASGRVWLGGVEPPARG